MKSGKQRRSELKARKQSRQTKVIDRDNAALEAEHLLTIERAIARGNTIVDLTALVPNNSYGNDEPDFVKLGYYRDLPFICQGCNSSEVWTSLQQKWWYEEAKGGLWTTAKYCRTCRHQERNRRDEARRIHLEGIAKKHRNRSFSISE
jgi:hypothetical protein